MGHKRHPVPGRMVPLCGWEDRGATRAVSFLKPPQADLPGAPSPAFPHPPVLQAWGLRVSPPARPPPGTQMLPRARCGKQVAAVVGPLSRPGLRLTDADWHRAPPHLAWSSGPLVAGQVAGGGACFEPGSAGIWAPGPRAATRSQCWSCRMRKCGQCPFPRSSWSWPWGAGCGHRCLGEGGGPGGPWEKGTGPQAAPAPLAPGGSQLLTEAGPPRPPTPQAPSVPRAATLHRPRPRDPEPAGRVLWGPPPWWDLPPALAMRLHLLASLSGGGLAWRAGDRRWLAGERGFPGHPEAARCVAGEGCRGERVWGPSLAGTGG